MSKLDKEKETIGYLKEMTLIENIFLLVLIIAIAFGIMYSNKKILNKIDLLEDL